MDLTDILEHKAEAEKKIKDALGYFMDDTGTQVQDVEYIAVFSDDEVLLGYKVRLVVEL